MNLVVAFVLTPLTCSPLSTLNASKSSTRKLIRLRNFYGKHYLFQGKNRFGDKFEECVYSFFRIFIFLLFVTLLARQSRTFVRSFAMNCWNTRATIKMKWSHHRSSSIKQRVRRILDYAKLSHHNHFRFAFFAFFLSLNTDSVDMNWNISHISSGSHVKSECVTGIINTQTQLVTTDCAAFSWRRKFITVQCTCLMSLFECFRLFVYLLCFFLLHLVLNQFFSFLFAEV